MPALRQNRDGGEVLGNAESDDSDSDINENDNDSISTDYSSTLYDLNTNEQADTDEDVSLSSDSTDYSSTLYELGEAYYEQNAQNHGDRVRNNRVRGSQKRLNVHETTTTRYVTKVR